MAQCLQNTSSQRLDYEAAEETLRRARAEALVGYRAAETIGDLDGAVHWSGTLSKAVAAFKEYRDSLSRESLLTIYAERILATYRSDDSGMKHLSIPGGVSDIDALHALNTYYSQRHVSGHGIISLRYLEWFADRGGAIARDVSTTRDISLCLEVSQTANSNRAEQQAILSAKNMVFAQPIEQVLVAAASACLDREFSPFSFRYLRGADPGVAVRQDVVEGLMVVALPDNLGGALSVAASGQLVSSHP